MSKQVLRRPDQPGDRPPQARASLPAEEDLDPIPAKLWGLRTAVSFIAGAAIIVLVFSRLNVDANALWDRLRRADPGYYLLALAVYYLTFLVRSLRWRQLLWNVGYHGQDGVYLPALRRIARIIILSWFANCVVPAKLGDAYRAYLLKRESQVSFSKTFGTILAERIIDMLLLLALLVLSALLAFRGAMPPEVASVTEVGLALSLALAVGLLMMRHLGQTIRRLLPGRFQHHYALFEEGTLGAFQALPMVLLYSVLAWLTEAGRLYFVGLALGLTQITLPVVVFVALASALLTTLPVTPAGLGFVETAIAGILVLAANLGVAPGLDPSSATSVAILDRTISYWSIIAVGGVIYLAGMRGRTYSY